MPSMARQTAAERVRLPPQCSPCEVKSMKRDVSNLLRRVQSKPYVAAM